MTSVQTLISALEAKERAIAIQNNKRSQLNSKMFFDARQMSLYPMANVVSEGVTQETLAITQPPENIEDVTANDDTIVSLFESNIKRLSGNNDSFLNTVMTHFYKEIEIMDFLNSSWADVKTKIKSQFKNSRVSAVSVILFLDKYVSKYRGTLTATNLQNKGFDMTRAPSDVYNIGDDYPVAESTFGEQTPMGKVHVPLKDVYHPDDPKKTGRPTALYRQSKEDFFNNNYKPQTNKIVKYFSPEKSQKQDAATDFNGNGMKKQIRKTVGRGSLQQNMSSKLYVDTKHLNNNKLAVKYKSTAKIIIKPTAINDKQKNVINSIIHNKFKQNEYDKLTTDERVIVDEFCLKANVNCVKSLDDTGDKLFMKYEILVGSINAGNDNPSIIQMLKEVVLELTKMKKISKLESTNILRQL